MVKLTPGQSVKTEREGQWRQTRVLQVDASLVRVSDVVKYKPARTYQSWSWKLNHFENIIDSPEVM